MFWIKLWCHFTALLQFGFYKLVYGGSLKIGKKVTWRRGFSIMKDKAAVVAIGDDCFFNNDCSIAANRCVAIGSGTLFGENVKIYDHNHRFRDAALPLKAQGFADGEVHIGQNCWIGSNAVILKGADIGDRCVIGAGCVIDGKVPADTIVKRSAAQLQLPIERSKK